MVLIESNSTTRGVQHRIFILRVLFGLVTTQLSHAGDDVDKSVLATERGRHRDMLVTTLPCRASDGATESILAVVHKGTTANHQGATVKRQGATADHQRAIIGRQGAIVDHQGVTANRQGVIAGRQGAAIDR
jgi:hypothetical protein